MSAASQHSTTLFSACVWLLQLWRAGLTELMDELCDLASSALHGAGCCLHHMRLYRVQVFMEGCIGLEEASGQRWQSGFPPPYRGWCALSR